MTDKSNTPAEHKDHRLSLIRSHLYLDGDVVRYKQDSSKYAAVKRKAGDIAHVSFNNRGYCQVCFGGIQMFLHVIVFALSKGRMPAMEIDHINCNRLDNSPRNLRESNRQQNNWNQSARKNNRSGVKNVSWVAKRAKWFVSLRTKFGRLSFGSYEDIEFAEMVAQAAREKYHDEFARDL